MSSSQQPRPYFLSTVLAAFRQPSTAAQLSTAQSSASKSSSSQQQSRPLASSSQSRATSTSPRPSYSQPARQTSSVAAQVSFSSRPGQNSPIPIPSSSSNRRRGSDSASEGFREAAQPNGPWYIGGRTAAGEEKFFKLGVVRRVRSIDRLSLDRLSL